jgi:hypothetical protein
LHWRALLLSSRNSNIKNSKNVILKAFELENNLMQKQTKPKQNEKKTKPNQNN